MGEALWSRWLGPANLNRVRSRQVDAPFLPVPAVRLATSQLPRLPAGLQALAAARGAFVSLTASQSASQPCLASSAKGVPEGPSAARVSGSPRFVHRQPGRPCRPARVTQSHRRRDARAARRPMRRTRRANNTKDCLQHVSTLRRAQAERRQGPVGPKDQSLANASPSCSDT